MTKTTVQDYRDYIESVYSACLVVGACAWIPGPVVGALLHNRYTCTNRDSAMVDMLSMDQVAVVYPERGIVVFTQNEQLGVEVEYAGTGWIGECDECGRWYIESRPMSMRVSDYCGCEGEYDPDL